MRIRDLHEGLGILKKYLKDHSASVGGSDHDVVYVALSEDLNEIPPCDINRLKELGFSLSDGGEGWEIIL